MDHQSSKVIVNPIVGFFNITRQAKSIAVREIDTSICVGWLMVEALQNQNGNKKYKKKGGSKFGSSV